MGRSYPLSLTPSCLIFETTGGMSMKCGTGSALKSFTPWCRILFEKLIVTQLDKKYPTFLWNPKVHHRVHKSLPLDSILRQPNPVHPIDPYPVLRSYQRFSPSPRHFETFRNNKKIFTMRGCWPHAQPPSWRTTPWALTENDNVTQSKILIFLHIVF
jgi:hypothetical protein